VDSLLLALRVVRVDVGGLRVAGGLTATEALATHGDLGHLHLRLHGRGHEGRRDGHEARDQEGAIQHGYVLGSDEMRYSMVLRWRRR